VLSGRFSTTSYGYEIAYQIVQRTFSKKQRVGGLAHAVEGVTVCSGLRRNQGRLSLGISYMCRHPEDPRIYQRGEGSGVQHYEPADVHPSQTQRNTSF
jgi:hypothetical protein